MRGLKDKVYIVTGGAGGIGSATARRLGEEGAIVVIADSDVDGAASVAEEIKTKSGRSMAVELDVRSRSGWKMIVERTIGEYGRIDGLVNNAGVTRDRSIRKMDDDEWDTVIDVNLKGAWRGCQAVIPSLTSAGGAIVNLSSEARWGAFGQSNYSSAKAGLVGLTRTVALEHARHSIRVNAVAPGTVRTAMVEAVPDKVRKDWLKDIPLGREAEPEEIASTIAYLLSEDSSYITGQIVGVNGGSAL